MSASFTLLRDAGFGLVYTDPQANMVFDKDGAGVKRLFVVERQAAGQPLYIKYSNSIDNPNLAGGQFLLVPDGDQMRGLVIVGEEAVNGSPALVLLCWYHSTSKNAETSGFFALQENHPYTPATSGGGGTFDPTAILDRLGKLETRVTNLENQPKGGVDLGPINAHLTQLDGQVAGLQGADSTDAGVVAEVQQRLGTIEDTVKQMQAAEIGEGSGTPNPPTPTSSVEDALRTLSQFIKGA